MRFWFLAPFFARLASKFEKSTNMNFKKCLKKITKVSKTQNFTPISNPLKKCLKNNSQKKVISKTSLTNMSKRGKSAFFRHVFANNFFGTFLKTFSTDLKSAWNSAFLIFDIFFDFSKENFFLVILVLFSNFEAKCAKNGAKNQKPLK